MCVCASITPGITHSLERSTISAPFGIETLGPTSRTFLFLTRMIWFLATVPVAGSIRLPARIATICPQTGEAKSTPSRSRRKIFSILFLRHSKGCEARECNTLAAGCFADYLCYISEKEKHAGAAGSGNSCARTAKSAAGTADSRRAPGQDGFHRRSSGTRETFTGKLDFRGAARGEISGDGPGIFEWDEPRAIVARPSWDDGTDRYLRAGR